MWELKEPKPVKLIVGVLASDQRCLTAAGDSLSAAFGAMDLVSDVWPFDQTGYYASQIGPHILRQFVSVEQLIDPGELAQIKHRTNAIERQLAATLVMPYPRPVNLDPGIIEPSKLVLATTKNYSHRIYLGHKMYAEVTLIFDKGDWRPLPYTYPDYRQPQYFDFFTQARDRLLQRLKDGPGKMTPPQGTGQTTSGEEC
jgi:hypothetical protein